MDIAIRIKKINTYFLFFFTLFNTTIICAAGNILHSYTYLGIFSKEIAEVALKKMPPLDVLIPHYSLDLYKIYYVTHTPDGHLTKASGLVAFPIHPNKPVGMVSYQHGTKATRTEAPSTNLEVNAVYPALFASHGGYVISMPDYLGLGDSELALHPYVQADTLADSSIDMLLAAKELARKLHYPITDDLFLAGYSEGGYATRVMYEAMLKNYPEIKINAVASGSSPYDFDEVMNFIINKPGPRATAYLAYFFYSLQFYRHYWSGLEEIYQKPYDTLVPLIFDGSHLFPEIIAALPQNPRDLLNHVFVERILSGTDAHSKELAENMNHDDFQATVPFLIVGTQGDGDVPFEGALKFYTKMKKKSDLVYLLSVSNVLDHVAAHPYVLQEMMNFFKKKECMDRTS